MAGALPLHPAKGISSLWNPGLHPFHGRKKRKNGRKKQPLHAFLYAEAVLSLFQWSS
jgi:hypothetical protein